MLAEVCEIDRRCEDRADMSTQQKASQFKVRKRNEMSAHVSVRLCQNQF